MDSSVGQMKRQMKSDQLHGEHGKHLLSKRRKVFSVPPNEKMLKNIKFILNVTETGFILITDL